MRTFKAMALREIVKFPHPMLRKKTQRVERIDEKIQELVKDMADTMYAAPGIGLAANQIGHLQRIAIIDLSIIDPANEGLIVLINPELVEASEELIHNEEGCLSIPDFRTEVGRHRSVTVRARDLENKEVEIKAEGLLSIALQHELDHLSGLLFIDRISWLKRDIFLRKIKKKTYERI